MGEANFYYFTCLKKSCPTRGVQIHLFVYIEHKDIKMKIYFCGSIRGGQQDLSIYAAMIKALRSWGTVLTEDVGQSHSPETDASVKDKWIHDRDVDWLHQSDVVVAEVTQPSLGVGYEIGMARSLGKPITCLFRPSSGRRLSAMIRGAEDGAKFTVVDYDENSKEKSIETLITEIMTRMEKLKEKNGKE